MQLQQLYEDFATLSPAGQLEFVFSYRKARAMDLVEVKTKSKQPVVSKIDISDEEKVVMKLLGLKMKDILALRTMNMQEEPDEDNDTDLFDENGLIEGDDL